MKSKKWAVTINCTNEKKKNHAKMLFKQSHALSDIVEMHTNRAKIPISGEQFAPMNFYFTWQNKYIDDWNDIVFIRFSSWEYQRI